MRAVRKHEDLIQLIVGFAVAVLVAWRLQGRGWPWYEGLPAGVLTFFGVAIVFMLIWYVRRKLTYEKLAARTRADLQAGGDGWPDKG